jgi:hypothetical protein
MNLLIEVWRFLRKRKKIWLAPIFLIIFIIGSLLIFAQTSIFAPFIYTLF